MDSRIGTIHRPTNAPISAQREGPFFKPTIQKKLSIGSSNDSYEVEADRVADKVVGMSDSQVSPVQQTGSLVQRKCSACGHKDEIQKKPIASTISPMIQRNTSGNEGRNGIQGAYTTDQ